MVLNESFITQRCPLNPPLTTDLEKDVSREIHAFYRQTRGDLGAAYCFPSALPFCRLHKDEFFLSELLHNHLILISSVFCL